MEMNVETKSIDAGPSERSGEIDHVTIPVWHYPGSLEVENRPKLYPPSPLLSAPVNTPISHEQQIGAGENSDHTITISEPHICRICVDDEDENDDVLVELGCRCRGQMSRMHRKCILEWYGLRIILEKNYNCELCNTILQVEVQLIVARGVADHQNGGRAILINALKSALAPYAAHIDVDRARTYPDLVYLLLNENADLLRQRFNQRNANVDGDQPAQAQPSVTRSECSLPVALMFGTVAVAVVVYTFLLHHFYGVSLFH